MLDSQVRVKLAVDSENSTLKVDFQPQTSQPIYDICDMQGRILKTGGIASAMTEVDLRDLDNQEYILLVLDGDRVFTEKFDVQSSN